MGGAVSGHPTGEQVNHLIKGKVADAGEEAEQDAGDDHDDRRVLELAAGRPAGFEQLVPEFYGNRCGS